MRVVYKEKEKKEGEVISDYSPMYLTNEKEYVVYALAYDSKGVWYLICTDGYDSKNPNTFQSIPHYFHESEFEFIDSHYSDFWIKTEDKERGIISLEHPLMVQDPFFYGEWIDKEDIKYYKAFSQIKKELDAEDALRSILFNIEKSDTKVVLFKNDNSLEKVFARIKKEIVPNIDIPIDSLEDVKNVLLSIEFFIPEKRIWFLFDTDCNFSIEEKEKLQDVLSTSELFWLEKSEIREFCSFFFRSDGFPVHADL